MAIHAVQQPAESRESGLMRITICPGCGAELPAHDGPVHRYIDSSAPCWAKYSELFAREYQDPAYRPAPGPLGID